MVLVLYGASYTIMVEWEVVQFGLSSISYTLFEHLTGSEGKRGPPNWLPNGRVFTSLDTMCDNISTSKFTGIQRKQILVRE